LRNKQKYLLIIYKTLSNVNSEPVDNYKVVMEVKE